VAWYYTGGRHVFIIGSTAPFRKPEISVCDELVIYVDHKTQILRLNPPLVYGYLSSIPTLINKHLFPDFLCCKRAVLLLTKLLHQVGSLPSAESRGRDKHATCRFDWVGTVYDTVSDTKRPGEKTMSGGCCDVAGQDAGCGRCTSASNLLGDKAPWWKQYLSRLKYREGKNSEQMVWHQAKQSANLRYDIICPGEQGAMSTFGKNSEGYC
jgi:hypothetical protein